MEKYIKTLTDNAEIDNESQKGIYITVYHYLDDEDKIQTETKTYVMTSLDERVLGWGGDGIVKLSGKSPLKYIVMLNKKESIYRLK